MGKAKPAETVTNPYKGMPSWLKDSLKERSAEGDRLWNEYKDMGPREILGQSAEEQAAFGDFVDRAGFNRDRGDAAYDGLESMDVNGGSNWWQNAASTYDFDSQLADMGKFEHGYVPGEFDSGYETREDFDGGYVPGEFDGGFDPETGAYTGDRLTDLMDRDFNLDYTDSVVDTTLDSMLRDERRKTLERQSRQAATGGITNTRSAVEDAVVGGENLRARAEMEAQMRDAAQRFETDSLFKKASALDSSDQYKSQDQREAEQFRAEMALKEQGFSDDAARFLSQQTLEEQDMAEDSRRFAAEYQLKEQGLSDQAIRALAEMDLTEQDLIQGAKEFGIEFDRSMLDGSQRAFENDRAFDLDRRTLMDQFATNSQKRDMAAFDIFSNYGKEGRLLEQAQLDAPRENAAWLSNYLSGTNLSGTMPTGGTVTSTAAKQSGLQTGVGVAANLAGAFMMSDERVKEDIETPEETALDKLAKLETGVQEYNYKDGFGHTRGRTSGLMAQDLERAGITGAVVDIDGVKHVDAYPILATVVSAVRELDQERRARA